MDTFIIIVVLIMTIVIATSIYRKTKYYKKVFSEDHYLQILKWLESEVAVQPTEDVSALQTDAGLILALTKSEKKGKVILQISLSESRGVTTHGVAGRILFLILTALNKNKAEVDFFYTDSMAHHLVMIKDSGSFILNDKSAVLREMKNYQALPFTRRSAEGARHKRSSHRWLLLFVSFSEYLPLSEILLAETVHCRLFG